MSQPAAAADLYGPPPPEVFPEPSGSWYAGLFGGMTFTRDMDGSAETDAGFYSEDGEVSFDNGFIVGGAIGYRALSGLRGELELSYAEMDLDQASGSLFDAQDVLVVSGEVDLGGDMGVLFVLANGWYDFNAQGSLQPYIGGGLGVGFTDVDVTFDGAKFGDSDTGFAFQLGAGVKWAMTRSVDLDVGYRFKSVLDVTLSDSATTDTFGPVDGRIADDLFMHVAQIGLTYNFSGF